MKRILAVISALFMMLTLGGCNNELMNVDGIMVPPSLTAQQSAIYGALTSQVGTDIQLKYPQTGDYRSAFIIRNLDDEPTEEAIAFYQTGLQSNRSSDLRINILDQLEDGSWVSACDITGGGLEIDRVDFGTLKSDRGLSMVVGYQTTYPEDKKLVIYRYEDGMLRGYNEYQYDVFSVLGLPWAEDDCLIYVGGSDSSHSRSARLVSAVEDGYQVQDEIVIGGLVDDYEAVISGNVSINQPALFLEGRKDGNLCTQIVTVQGEKLVNLTGGGVSNLASRSLREQQVFCTDIDGDGVTEVPSPVLMNGYPQGSNSEFYYIEWLAYSDQGFLVKEITYINSSDGYQLRVPSEWKDMVFVKTTSDQDEVQFLCRNADGSEGDELLRIRTVQKTDLVQTGLTQGFFKLASVGQITYLAKLNIETESIYRLSKEELIKRFSTIL